MTNGHKVQPTEFQKNVADNAIAQATATGRINKGKAILDAGGSPHTAKTPSLVWERKGFKVYMANHGVTEDNLAQMLGEDLANKPGERLGEMKLAAELMGLTNKDVNVNVSEVDKSLVLIKQILNGKEEPVEEE